MIIYGRNVIREALQAGAGLKEAFLQTTADNAVELAGLENDLLAAGVPVARLPREKLEAVSHSREHQGAAARIKGFGYSRAEPVLDALGAPPFVIVLDRVQDPHNLGAIVRTAAGAGADLVVLAAHGGCRVTPAVLKTSAGCAFRVPIAIETNLPRFIASLRGRGCWAYAAVMDGSSCFDLDFAGGVVLVFGSEGDGIRRLVLETCDFRVSVPMARPLDSLNVSVSAAVIAFQVRRARIRAGGGR
ncbi:MAG TPA: 23S rRNA (guanosine(2251)-2'-O)-methyltransferase RlmB [bacterium]|nr:23S rRNA (guanosine(2251)-2'-O)-methyltransferase RlmB [bacterium]HPQ66026.1 23S rRNA (guanosine(2251)-2'-O)-methyltransferase RlmB [bacterium]